MNTHYSKSQFFVQKFNIDKTHNIFTSFSPPPKKNRHFFLVKSKLYTYSKAVVYCFSTQLKSPKLQHFHEFFTQKKIDSFLGKSKLNLWTKDEDFEQCGIVGSFIRKVKANRGCESPFEQFAALKNRKMYTFRNTVLQFCNEKLGTFIEYYLLSL